MNPLAIAGLAGLICGLGGGVYVTEAVMGERIAIMEASQAKAVAASAQIYHRRFVDEKARGDALSNRLAHTESDLILRTLEVTRAVSKVTTGRACLGDAAVRLLNGAPRTVPQAAGASVAESAAIATDTDVAGWIGNAQGQYETCRARLGALIDYEEGRPDDRTEQ
ncbi:hypothetical protein PL263_05040 [Methylomonas sp. EFPC3]|uniref:hypothetical protein n=1 Tax=Methylomonas sp. EFPC3 TaxID=3021710 RepID=UPI002416B680|nr:hypothetical protein [Methylomonas sp. EFPC3]WFP51395.1 hypothetical protein PL263_05040 [Methylomonas sp. EFPC3]